MSPTNRVLVALAAGLAGGIAISAFGGPPLFALVSFVEPIGTLWVNAIRMTVVPLVVSLLIVSVASVDVGTIGRIGWRGLLTFVVLLSASALFAALIAPPLFARLPIDAAATASLGGSGRAAATVANETHSTLPTFSQWLVELVPTNPIRAAADGTMFPLVIFALLFALASTRINPDLRQSLIRFFQAISETSAGPRSLDNCRRSVGRLCADARIHSTHWISSRRRTRVLCPDHLCSSIRSDSCPLPGGSNRGWRFFSRVCAGHVSGASGGLQLSLFARFAPGAYRGCRG